MSLVAGVGLAIPGRLQPCAIELRSGELTCLIGPNGSGKTSLLHALAGIGRAQGKVLIDGIDPRGLAPALRSRLLSFLPASRELVWPLSVRDLTALGLYGDERDRRIGESLAFFGLETMAERRVDRLSTGERSRVLIARALASDARLLLLDEPTANLDPSWQLRLLDRLKELAAKEGHVVLIALHDLDAAGRFADRLLVMDSGRIAADGEPRLLLESRQVADIFEISWTPEGWCAVRRTGDPQSSP
jgi:iron complex transport system ATP-binding protein